MLVLQVLEGLICSLYKYYKGSYARYTGIGGAHMLVIQVSEGAHMLLIQVLEWFICSLYKY
jgi:hypothetical protein